MNRRETLLLVGSSLVAVPAIAQETPRRGGVMTVHFSTEQRILNPSLQASTGVYIDQKLNRQQVHDGVGHANATQKHT